MTIGMETSGTRGSGWAAAAVEVDAAVEEGSWA